MSSLPSRRAKANAAAAATNDATNNGARPATAPVKSEEGEVVGVPGLSSLTVADAVVTEYEKLLAAMPTMARHMGKLQLDTEVMAEGERQAGGHRSALLPSFVSRVPCTILCVQELALVFHLQEPKLIPFQTNSLFR